MADRTQYSNDGEVTRTLIIESSEPETKFGINTVQDLGPVIDTVTTLREAHAVIGHRKSGQMTPVAEIPMIVYEQAVREGWDDDDAAWKRWLNDPGNSAFRITSGRV
jgi:hypothetical protein